MKDHFGNYRLHLFLFLDISTPRKICVIDHKCNQKKSVTFNSICLPQSQEIYYLLAIH